MSREQRRAAALDELDGLARKGLVRRSSIRTDEENGIVSFTYSCGVLGGILFTPADELEEMTLDAGENGCERAAQCLTLPMWKKLDAVMDNYLSGVSVQDLLDGKA